MRELNLKKILEIHKLDKSWLANALFPRNNNPRQALNRILAGKGYLDTKQLAILAEITFISLQDLFDEKVWEVKLRDDQLNLTFNEYSAVIYTSQPVWVTEIFVNGALRSERLFHDKGIKLTEYLDVLNDTVTEMRNKTQN